MGSMTNEVLSEIWPPAGSEKEDWTSPKISFYIPCHNEEEHVVSAISQCIEACNQLSIDCEILVVDDGSTDSTSEQVIKFGQETDVKNLFFFRNDRARGVATNFVDIAFKARGKYYRLVCGDNIEPLESHIGLLKELDQSEIIIPYYTQIKGRTAGRHVLSRIYVLLVQMVSGIKLRYFNGHPIFLRSHVIRYHVETTGLGYQAEFLTRLIYEGFSWKEVPLIAFDRSISTSLTLKNFILVAHSLFSIAIRRIKVVLRH